MVGQPDLARPLKKWIPTIWGPRSPVPVAEPIAFIFSAQPGLAVPQDDFSSLLEAKGVAVPCPVMYRAGSESTASRFLAYLTCKRDI